ncbi:hypothetical protein ACFXKY_37445 [Streptomyces canus]|uniref:hypothetical protein n=1 Tax=Streptomyces canus TaxID=58343 RepID=UPI00367F9CF5
MQPTSAPIADDRPMPNGPSTASPSTRTVALPAENRLGPHSAACLLDTQTDD